MREKEFRDYLKRTKKAEKTIDRYVLCAKRFEEYLESEHKGLKSEKVTPDILSSFVNWSKTHGKKKIENIYQHMWGIDNYYRFLEKEDVCDSANEWKGILQVEKTKLTEFQDVDKSKVELLTAIGIRTAAQLLDKGKTQKGRENIAKESGVNEEYVLELVKLSNLARIPGLKKQRARLYYNAGLDSLVKITKFKPSDVRELLIEYIAKSGFQGSASTLGEANYTVYMANFLPKILEGI
jgi:hypothetical protein